MTNSIAVSVCCLTYNHENIVRDALEGFVMQKTDFPFEIVICDDASTDRTPEIIAEYAKNYKNLFRPIFRDKNLFGPTGVYPFFTDLYPAARGNYIAECDGDDYWTDPYKLQKQYDFMESNKDYAMCHHAYLVMEAKTGLMHSPSSKLPRDYNSDEMIAFNGEDYSIHTSTKFWRNVWKTATPEKRKLLANFWGDHPINVMMGMYGPCKYVAGIKPSIFRRAHPGSSWTTLPGPVIEQKVKEMQQRINKAILETGNERWIKLRRNF